MSARNALKREIRVAVSRRAQPVWFRVLKWTITITLVIRFWKAESFWWWVLAAFALSMAVHFIWRWKTRSWTQPWGGWSDIEAGKDPEVR